MFVNSLSKVTTVSFRHRNTYRSITHTCKAVKVGDKQMPSFSQINFKRHISEDSWAAEGLKKQGEKLDPSDKIERVVTPGVVDQPTEGVKKLVEQILSLNLIEIMQLQNLLQVCGSLAISTFITFET